MPERSPAKLALEDGTVLSGLHFGAPGTLDGEVVFNTSMAGYQEILTDPSYRGQIVTMTYPLIGNYGVGQEDTESRAVQVAGFAVRELCGAHSNFRSDRSLDQYLRENNIVGIEQIDTRALTRKIRLEGAMKGIISSEIRDDEELVDRARLSPGLVGRDLVREVTRSGIESWSEGYHSPFSGPVDVRQPTDEGSCPHIVAIDCGMKQNISRNLVEQGFEVTVVPASATPEQILELKPDGIFVSNGPGDPEPVSYTIGTIRALLKKEVPMFGICLGLQLIGQALGGTTYKLKFGHRGGNQPVINKDTGQVEITSQNHGFALDAESLPENEVRLTHMNLNDDTLEGFAHKSIPVFAVQYHPEASPGPHDATYLFSAFYDMVRSRQAPECLGG